MSVLNYWIAPQSPELKARTMLAHNTLMVRNLVCGAEHPYELTYTLGLFGAGAQAARFNWYAGVDNPTLGYAGSRCLYFASEYFHESGREFRDLDTTALWLRLRSLSEDSQLELVRLLERRFDFAHAFTHPTSSLAERANIMQQSDKIPGDVLAKLEMNLASLEASLLEKDPQMPTHLRAIHSLLISYPETVHLLDDSEIASIISGAEAHTNTEIVKATAAKTSRKKVTTDDL